MLETLVLLVGKTRSQTVKPLKLAPMGDPEGLRINIENVSSFFPHLSLFFIDRHIPLKFIGFISGVIFAYIKPKAKHRCRE